MGYVRRDGVITLTWCKRSTPDATCGCVVNHVRAVYGCYHWHRILGVSQVVRSHTFACIPRECPTTRAHIVNGADPS